ncbi:MAG: hypothetical protein KJZ85_15290 [Rhodobacteraceae bacterium]|nr:hypothetical protein [Paracoccaceae bacterium]
MTAATGGWWRAAALAGVAAGLWAVPAAAQIGVPVIGVCAGFPPGAERHSCRCEAATTRLTVWGSGPYTADSDICTAARHAGVIGVAGGVVVLFAGPQTDRFEGSAANGIETWPWTALSPSFVFVAGQDAPPMPVCGSLPEGTDRLDCICPEPPAQPGFVWGSGPYTSDSDICAAARHAGVIGAGRGPVRVLRVQGLPAYAGSTRNGVSSGEYPAWPSSFTFDHNLR